MKGTPQFPQCGSSSQVVQILEHVGVAYKALNVYDSAELRDGIKIYSNWPTIPQLYAKGEFVGGCDIVREVSGITFGDDAVHKTDGLAATPAAAQTPALSMLLRKM